MPWHCVLAPEGVLSGDGRKFGIDALRWRDLPLPLSWQKVNTDGHNGSVVVGRIDEIWREDNLIKASGTFLETPEADEAIGLLADGGIRGVSVDVDDATMELEGAADGEPDKAVQVFPDGRICGATLVPDPGFRRGVPAPGRLGQRGAWRPLAARVARTRTSRSTRAVERLHGVGILRRSSGTGPA